MDQGTEIAARRCHNRGVAAAKPKMVFLGFGKYARADRIFALEPIDDGSRGSGRRTRVWVEGIPEPLVASRTEQTILADMGHPEAAKEPAPRRRSAVPPGSEPLFETD
jgi:hypothetical protein